MEGFRSELIACRVEAVQLENESICGFSLVFQTGSEI
jgi:hypothetical protein